jgi:chromatin assembly factor 1 subunit A
MGYIIIISKNLKKINLKSVFYFKKHIDYDINSDDEWEDEPEGESIADSEKEDEDDIVDDEDDDGFFVPHGHLSDDELDEEDRLVSFYSWLACLICFFVSCWFVLKLDPETKKARENCKNEEYERERQKKSKVLIPKWYIAYKYWDSPEDDQRNNPSELRLLERFKVLKKNF